MWSYTEFGPVVRRRCRFKTFSYLELLQSICSADQNHSCNFGRRYHEEQFCEFIWIGPVVQEEIPFKGISYLDIWQPFCSAECNYLCNFGREYQQEQFCKIKCFLKDFLSGALAASWSVERKHVCNFERGHHVKLYEIWTSGSGGVVF